MNETWGALASQADLDSEDAATPASPADLYGARKSASHGSRWLCMRGSACAHQIYAGLSLGPYMESN